MLVYGGLWMGLMVALLLTMLYVAHGRGLLRTGVLVVFGLGTAAGWAVRVLTYVQFLRILSFYELEQGLLLAATVFGTLLQIGYGFVMLGIINLVWPRTLRSGDVAVLSLLGASGVSLCGVVYGMGKLLVERML